MTPYVSAFGWTAIAFVLLTWGAAFKVGRLSTLWNAVTGVGGVLAALLAGSWALYTPLPDIVAWFGQWSWIRVTAGPVAMTGIGLLPVVLIWDKARVVTVTAGLVALLVCLPSLWTRDVWTGDLADTIREATFAVIAPLWTETTGWWTR